MTQQTILSKHAPPLPLPTNVHQQETSVDARKLRLADAMYAAGCSGSSISSFRNCGQDMLAIQLIETPGTYRVVRVTCKSRWCERCTLVRSATIRKNLESAMKDQIVRMITLTQRHTDRPLKEQLAELIQAFRRLRTRANWRRCVVGGAFFVELTRNHETHTWHPHVHVVAIGNYYDHADLKKDWLSASGNSIVHITLVRDKSAIGKYVTKYLTKPIDDSKWTSDLELTEAIDALRSKRTVGTFGDWTTKKLLAKPDHPPARLIGWIAGLRIKASEGDKLAQKLVEVADSLPAHVLGQDVAFPPNNFEHAALRPPHSTDQDADSTSRQSSA